MSNTLIINVRRQMPWQQRLASDTSTAVLWGWWLWLCRPALGMISWLSTFGASLPMSKLVMFGSAASLEPMAALVGTSSTLMLWNMLPTQATPAAKARTIRDYSAHFGLSEDQILSGQSSSVCVVHHGENGQITGIERRV